MQILVADDEPTTVVLLQGMLVRLGHEVCVAHDGHEAWDRIQSNEFRLVITAGMIPGLDGLELCRRIRARAGAPYTYVILLTVCDGKGDRLIGLDAGADDLLARRPDPAELEARLKIAARLLTIQAELERKNARLEALAATDDLTGLANRREIGKALTKACSLACRSAVELSVVLLDVDHFKSYNDRFGHPAGDDVLRTLAVLLRSTVRGHDVVGRHGGEEFIIILPGTDAPGASRFAERVRESVERYPWPLRPITASFGVVTATPETLDERTLIERADRALYHSKQRGRNLVTHEREAKLGIGVGVG